MFLLKQFLNGTLKVSNIIPMNSISLSSLDSVASSSNPFPNILFQFRRKSLSLVEDQRSKKWITGSRMFECQTVTHQWDLIIWLRLPRNVIYVWIYLYTKAFYSTIEGSTSSPLGNYYPSRFLRTGLIWRLSLPFSILPTIKGKLNEVK